MKIFNVTDSENRPDAESTVENGMTDSSNDVQAADAAPTETSMKSAKKKSTKATTTKKAKPAKAAAAPKAKTKTPAAAKPEVAKEKPGNRTFAIRITDDELEKIHKASGPRNAARFIRQVAAAFAAEDEGAFRTIVKESRAARA